MQRYGWIIGLRPERVEDYKREHAAVWPGVLKMIKECNIQNYSIYLRKFPDGCLLYTSPSPRDRTRARMPSSA